MTHHPEGLDGYPGVADRPGPAFARVIAGYVDVTPPRVLSFTVDVHTDGAVRLEWSEGRTREVETWDGAGAMAQNLRGLLLAARSGEVRQ